MVNGRTNGAGTQALLIDAAITSPYLPRDEEVTTDSSNRLTVS